MTASPRSNAAVPADALQRASTTPMPAAMLTSSPSAPLVVRSCAVRNERVDDGRAPAKLWTCLAIWCGSANTPYTAAVATSAGTRARNA